MISFTQEYTSLIGITYQASSLGNTSSIKQVTLRFFLGCVLRISLPSLLGSVILCLLWYYMVGNQEAMESFNNSYDKRVKYLLNQTLCGGRVVTPLKA